MKKDTPYHFETGEVLLIDKPLRWTSTDVVRKIRNALKLKKIGHAGTLDPLATGLLILCTGKMTKQIDSYQAEEKEYTGTLVLGKTTPCIDLELPFDAEYEWKHITKEQIQEAVIQQTGEIEQLPPLYSAVQVEGKRLYDLARKGKVPKEITPRRVTVKLFEIDATQLPEVHFRIICSKGTYIRSVVRDIGEQLGCGAYLKALRRTRIGNFLLQDAMSVDDFIAHAKQNTIIQ